MTSSGEQTHSSHTLPSHDELLRRVSFADVLPAAADTLAQSRLARPNGRKYLDALREVYGDVGADQVEDLVDCMRSAVQFLLNMYGISPRTGKSRSWAEWDIGKQRYFADHPDQIHPAYHDQIGNPVGNGPMDRNVRSVMVRRQVGLEIDNAVILSDSTPRALAHHPGYGRVVEMIAAGERSRSPEGYLPSRAMVVLGQQVLGMAASLPDFGRTRVALDRVADWQPTPFEEGWPTIPPFWLREEGRNPGQS